MKKIIFLFFVMILMCFYSDVKAAEKTCNQWASQGASVCRSKTYQGYKCAWNGDLKGGSRCYKSNNLAEEKKENITSCSQINSQETCTSSIVNGEECIWKQNACYGNESDGSGETIIADDQNDRDQIEEDKKKENNNSNSVVTNPTTTPVDGNFKFCEEDGVLKTFQIVGYLITIIKILVPLLLIIFGSIDFGKAVIAGDDKGIQTATTMLVTRAIGGIIIFFIPTIIHFATSLINSWSGIKSDFINCETCLNQAGQCYDIRKDACNNNCKTKGYSGGKLDSEIDSDNSMDTCVCE